MAERGKRYLVVANRTVGGIRLAEHLQGIIAVDPAAEFFVLVPAIPSSMMWSSGAMPDVGIMPIDWHKVESELRLEADGQLAHLLASLRSFGVKADGEVGLAEPLVAMDDALKKHRCDEIIVSSLPIGVSRWLKLDLSQRARRRFGLPLTTVVNDGGGSLPDLAATPSGQPSSASPTVHVIGNEPRIAAALAGSTTPCKLTESSTFDGSTPAAAADLVIVDLDSLGATAWDELVRAIASQLTRKTAVVAMTSDPNRVDWRRAHDAGAAAYLSKPSSDSELAWLLDTFVLEYTTLGAVRDVPR